MTIIIDHDITSFGSTSAIAIWAVTGEDGGLGEVPVPGQPTFSRVTYTPTRGGFGPTRINALVNDTTDVTVVRGVDSTFTFLDPTGASRPITDFVGITFEEVVGGGTRLIRVIYDATQCGGKNYFAFDAAGNQIEVPTPIVV